MQSFPRQPDLPLLPLLREDRPGTAREEDTPEFQLTRGLETQLERFLDIFCFVQQFSCEPITHEALPGKIALAADSFFGISLPYRADYAILIIANENNVLPEWYENPGVAGKSRLTFFAGNLSDLLTKYSEFLESHPGSSQENWTDIQSFLNSEKYTAGKLRAEPGFFSVLELTQNARVVTFSMMRFDGNPGRGWLLTGVKNPEILRTFQEKPSLYSGEKMHALQRVRNLEKLSVEEMPEEETEPEMASESAPAEAAPETQSEAGNAENTENEQEFYPLELYVRLSDGEISGAEMDETFILGEKPECPSVNTEEICYVREERLIPFNPEKFSREFHAFLAERVQKRRKSRRKVCPEMRFHDRCDTLRLFFAHAHPAVTQRWRKVPGDFSDLRENESKTPVCACANAPFGAADLWETAETSEIPRQKLPILPPETVMKEIPVTVHAVLGRKKLPLEAILALKPGAVLNFGLADTQNLAIFVSDKCVAQGEMLAVGTAVAVEILEKTE